MPAKGRPREFDIKSALDTALLLFWRHGYEGVSISTLSKALKISIPSLYAAFGNKEGIFLKAVEHYAKDAGRIYHESFKKKTAYEVAKAILIGEVNLVTQKGKPNGCMMVQGALVASPKSEGLTHHMAQLRLTAEGWMEDRFRQAQKEGDLPPGADPKILACLVMTVNSGLAVQARSGVSKEQLHKVVVSFLEGWPFLDS